jgi:hypothetical protein
MESKPCLFCLENVDKNNSLQNPIGCHCSIIAHKQCFQTWFDQKQQMECPICHTLALPNPVVIDDIHIVYIDTTMVQEHRRRYRGHEKAIAFCCCTLLGWAIGISVIEAVRLT